MHKAAKFDTILQFALCLLAFTIPLKFLAASFCLFIVAILWLAKGQWKEAIINFKKRKILSLWVIMYALLIISSLYSIDKEQAVFDLKIKLAYFILPFVIGTGLIKFSRKHIEQIFLSLIGGIVVGAVFSLIKATIIWYPENYYNAFFYHGLVQLLDPNAVYTAWYTLFAVSMLIFMSWEHYFKGIYQTVRILLVVFLFVYFFLLSARMFILLFIIFLFVYVVRMLFKNIFRAVVISIITIVVLFTTYRTVFNTNNIIKNRYMELVYGDRSVAWLTDYSNTKEEDFNNVSLRLFLWRIGTESVTEKKAWLTGVGNGDVHHTLQAKMKQYKVPGIDDPDPDKQPGFAGANLHNMYLQNYVMLGFSGLILLIIIVLLPFFYIHKVQPFQPFLVFHITSALFMMQEAVLQTQAGIFFYIYISSMFWAMYYNKKEVIFY